MSLKNLLKNTLILAVATPLLSVNAATKTESTPYVPGEILVKFKEKATKDRQEMVRTTHRARLKRSFNKLNVEQWQLPEGAGIEETIAELEASGDVEYAEPNYRRQLYLTPNDAGYGEQWALNNTGQNVNGTAGTSGADMGLEDAWETTTGSNTVNVAIIDEGFQLNHPDLDGNFDINNDRNFDVSDDATDEEINNASKSGDTHGTNVAGCIGAEANLPVLNPVGGVGVAWDINMIPLRTDLSVSQIVQAYDYAIEKGAHIINASFGSPQYSQTEAEAVNRLEEAGILLVVAAGNYDVNNDLIPDYPSNLPNPNILSVAASDQDDGLISWSQHGALSVDVMAPGRNIYTTEYEDSYTYVNGTSMSAPLVSGVAALIKSNDSSAAYTDLKGRIMAGVTHIDSAEDHLAAGGRVDAKGALDASEGPVITIRSYSISDNDNGVLEAGETVDLDIVLENSWATAPIVSATLAINSDSSYSDLTINTPSGTYGALFEPDTDTTTTSHYDSPNNPYSITLSSTATGHQRIPLQLTITAGSYSVVRYFELEAGGITGTSVSGTIGEDDQDDVHYYVYDIPPSTETLTITTTSANDIDLMVQKDTRPQFMISDDNNINPYIDNESVTCSSIDTCSNSSTGNEEVSLTNPGIGKFWIAIVNTGGTADTNYTINVEAVESSSSGAIPWYLLLLPLLRLRRRHL